MMKKLGISIAGIGLLAMGCAVENEGYDNDRFSDMNVVEENPDFNFDRDPNDYGSSDVVISEGAVYTNTGGYNVNGPAQQMYSYGDTAFMNADIVRSEQDSAMALVYITDLDHPAFTEVGRTTTFRGGQMVANDENVAEEGDPSLGLTACVGPTEGNWEIDEPAEEVQVTVEETDEGETVLVMESDIMDTEMQIDIR